MAKRKSGVNDIIYELDNEDSDISSDDEVKQPKIIRIEENHSLYTTQSDSNTQSSCLDVIDIDSSTEKIDKSLSPNAIRNGGKSPVEYIIVDEVSETPSPKPRAPRNDRDKKFNSDTIFNEDIIIDSPATNSDPGVVGCENRTPIVTVKFRDNKLANNYKKKIKAFMLNLIKLNENCSEPDNDTDLELDIWPEDLEDYNEHPEEDYNEQPEKPADNLFFIDTDPCSDMPIEIPCYSQNTPLICNAPEQEQLPLPMAKRKGPTCFNCNGSHTMRECKEPWNNTRITENRKVFAKKGRYHVEDEQKYGHLVPGRISGQLRHALGLKRHELPMHIYRMRQLGYPPGWLEEARISHSGITLFGSSGQATLDPEEEEGEVCEPGSKDKYDIKKILDFPGFNVPASSRYKEEAHTLGLPPMSEADSKLAMLAVLAPNAMHAYKRKKLALFPDAGGDATHRALHQTAEMDIDSGDEIVDFPSQPPLPDDAPPPPPPPPDSSPPPPPLPKTSPPRDSAPPLPPSEKTTKQSNTKKSDTNKDEVNTSDDDLEVLEVIEVADIPVPFADMITIDVDGDVSEPESGYPSPTLDDLEQKKRLLLDALGTEEPKESATDSVEINDSNETVMQEPAETTDAETEDGSQTVEVPSDMEIVDEINDKNKPVNDKVGDGSSEKPVDIDDVDSNGKANGEKDIAIDKSEVASTSTCIPEVASNSIDKPEVASTSTDKPEVASTSTDKPEVTSTDKPEVASTSTHMLEVASTSTDMPEAASTSTDMPEVASTSTDIPEVASTSTDIPEVASNLINKLEVASISSDKTTVGPSSLESTPKGSKEAKNTESDLTKTPTSAKGLVRGTEYGTPVINVASSYLKLPSDDKFAKDICDVINFENLPNSIGKYKKISTLLKKVKSEVDRIQES